MSIPILTLLGFTLWTVLFLLMTIGIYRWSRILTGRVAIKDFRADVVEGEDWYLRAMRAHANCLENLPIFMVVVFSLTAMNMHGNDINTACLLILVARVFQSVVHVAFTPTNSLVLLRFVLFFSQLLSFMYLLIMTLARGLAY